MVDNADTIRKTNRSLVVLGASLLIPAVWLIPQLINVYDYPVLGAIYESIWLPMILCLFLIPVFSFIFWMKSKYQLSSL